jgi:hypothetical protein
VAALGSGVATDARELNRAFLFQIRNKLRGLYILSPTSDAQNFQSVAEGVLIYWSCRGTPWMEITEAQRPIDESGRAWIRRTGKGDR